LQNASSSTEEAARVADCWRLGQHLLQEVDIMLNKAHEEDISEEEKS